MREFRDLSGLRFGSLTVLYAAGGRKSDTWCCVCDCGAHEIVSARRLSFREAACALCRAAFNRRVRP